MRSSMPKPARRSAEKIKLTQSCPSCHGYGQARKKSIKLKLANGGDRVIYQTCQRCGGSGQMLSVGSQTDTRIAKQDGLTEQEQACHLTGGKRRSADLSIEERAAHDFWMTGNVMAKHALIEALHDLVVEIERKEGWKYQFNKKRPQPLSLATMAIAELEHPIQFGSVSSYALFFGCARATWKKKWAHRYRRIADIPQKWLYYARCALGE